VFHFTTPEEGSNLSLAALWAALRKVASIGDEWDGEDALPWANRCPVYLILQTTEQSL